MDNEESTYSENNQNNGSDEGDDMGESEFSLYIYSDCSDNVIDLISEEDQSSNEMITLNQPFQNDELVNQERDEEITEILHNYENESLKDYEEKEVQTSPSLLENYLEKYSKPSISANDINDESCTCTICLEPWTINTEHQLVSLKCGHLFGESCILRWISEETNKDNARCPNCNSLAKKHHIRKLYAKTVRLNDSAQLAKAWKEIEKEKSKRVEVEKEINRNRDCLKNILTECEKTKRAIMEEERKLEILRSNKINNIAAIHKASVLKARQEAFQIKTVIEFHPEASCRVLTTSDILGVMIATQKNFNQLFSGYGLRKISTFDFKVNEFIPIHQNIIKDVCFHPHDALVLSASLDQTLKLTNLMSCSNVMTQNLEAGAWSCCWNEKDRNYFYAGLQNGKIVEFDIRYNQNHVNEIICKDKVPVSSLQYFIKEDETFDGVIATHLKSCYLHVKNNSNQFKSLPFPIRGNFISSHFDKKSNMLLISSRPNKSQLNVNHSVSLKNTPNIIYSNFFILFFQIYQLLMVQDDEMNQCLNTDVYRIFNGGRRADQFLKSKIFSHPNDINSSLIIAGDQDISGYLVWDLLSKEKLQVVKLSAPSFDISLMKLSTSDYILSALTENKIFVHKWCL